jgi:hypothetical protein
MTNTGSAAIQYLWLHGWKSLGRRALGVVRVPRVCAFRIRPRATRAAAGRSERHRGRTRSRRKRSG